MTQKKPTLDDIIEISNQSSSGDFIQLTGGEEIKAKYVDFDITDDYRPEENDPDFMQAWKNETVIVFRFEVDGVARIFKRKAGNATADFARVLKTADKGAAVTIGKKTGTMGSYYVNLG